MAETNGSWFPGEWQERVRRLASGQLTPVTPRRSATVILLRDGVEGPEVHMLRRRASMAFAGGVYAYPGGAVDPRDEAAIRWAGPPRAWWAERLGVDEELAQALVCAAARETFEEAGVLFAGDGPDSVVADTTGPGWEADRAALTSHEWSFAEFLDRRSLVLRSDLLAGWARWITPEFEARRYDTWFFVAALPEGQRARNASTEADRAVWLRPAVALDARERGELAMMPPTMATLREVLPHATAGEAHTAAVERRLAPVLARTRREADHIVLSWPGHDEFTQRVRLDPDDGGGQPVGRPASPGVAEEPGQSSGTARGEAQ